MSKGRIVEDDVPLALKKKEQSYFENMRLEEKKSEEVVEQQKEIQRKKSEDEKKNKEEDLDLEAIKLDDEEEEPTEKKKPKGVAALVKVEDRMKGSVPWSFYYRFFTGPGGIKAILMFVFITLAQMLTSLQRLVARRVGQ